MTDLIKALLIGAILVALGISLTAVVALLVPILIFLLIVGVVWIAISILNNDDEPPTDPPP